ncbi:MAG: hypothetical protein RJA49_2069 [Actinomycetota bacterium]
MSTVDVPDLAVVEAAVAEAIHRKDPSNLRILGHGEISIVLGWPTDAPSHALKRVPPFRGRAQAEQYMAVVESNLQLLRDADVPIWPTTLHVTERADGSAVVYHRQPVAPGEQVGTNVLRAATPSADHPLLAAIVRHAAAVVRPGVGFDVQAANWIWDGTAAHQLDFTSPFLLDETGKDLRFDTSGFLREYPAVLRPVLKRELLKVIVRYTTAEGAIGDLVGNLQKEELHDWVDPAIEAARRAGVTIDRAATTKMFEDDKKLMPLTLKLRKGQRWWVTHTGRRYETLLPERTTYDR